MDPAPRERPLVRRLAPLAALGLVLSVLAWTFVAEGAWRGTRNPVGYYDQLTEAVLSGRLYLRQAPDPRLASLADPWAGYQGIPRMHDASYYHGRYYLYFGVAPVVLFFAPCRLLTGTYPSEAAAGCFFCLASFGFGLACMRRLLRSASVSLPPWAAAAFVLVWGLGTYTLTLAQTANFYAVPILSAAACLVAALYFSCRAVESRRTAEACAWLALASAAWAMGVGGRPHYVVSLPLLLVPLAYCLGKRPSRRRLLGLGAATVAPAAAIGACLACYNYARFGSVAEFGFHYQFTGGSQRDVSMWHPDMIATQTLRYLLGGNLVVAYFPFLVPHFTIIGVLRWMPVASASVLFPFLLLARSVRSNRAWVCVGLVAFLAGAIHLVVLSLLPVGHERYTPDFLPPLMLAALMAWAWLISVARGWAGRLVGWAFGLLAAATCALAAIRIVDMSPSGVVRERVARLLDRPAGMAERALGVAHGPVSLEVTFSQEVSGRRETLLATGGGTDAVYAERLDRGRERLGFLHLGNPALLGAPFEDHPGQRHTVVIELGSLYPPLEHPYFDGWRPELAQRLLRTVRVEVDGRSYLQAASSFHPSDPYHVDIGWSPQRGLETGRFKGAISNERRLPATGADTLATEGWKGPVRLTLRWPRFTAVHSEPLVASGRPGAGEMLFVTYLSAGRLRLSLDANAGGGLESEEIPYDGSKTHQIDVSLGSLDGAAGPDAVEEVRYDGKPVLHALRPTVRAMSYEAVFGYNSCHLGTAETSFTGEMSESAPPADAFLQTSAGLEGEGALEESFILVPMPAGSAEPLVVSGVTGRADMVYVRYLDGDQMQIGVDHWSVGAVQSAPLPMKAGTLRHLTVESRPFLPEAGSPRWGRVPEAEQRSRLSRIRLFLDGALIVDAPWSGYPCLMDQVALGANPVGGSTCGPRFSGKIVGARRIPPGEQGAPR